MKRIGNKNVPTIGDQFRDDEWRIITVYEESSELYRCTVDELVYDDEADVESEKHYLQDFTRVELNNMDLVSEDVQIDRGLYGLWEG